MIYLGIISGAFFTALLGAFLLLPFYAWRLILVGAAAAWFIPRIHTTDLLLIPIFATLVLLLWLADGDGRAARILNTKL